MPAISKIRFTNIIYDNKQKRFNDEIFVFDGHNGAVLLENGGGKTVFIQCAIQAVIPHADLGERKIKETLLLDNTCAHIAIEWILRDKPRKYCVTSVSLFKDPHGSVSSYRFINEYVAGSGDSIEYLPFAIESTSGRKRPASKEEIGEYYSKAKASSMAARTFNTIHEYQKVLSKDYGIIASEWRSQLEINRKEGGVEEFFDGCSTTGHLVDNLLIPSIESVIAGDGEKGFAKTFEIQRDTFKEYNRLLRLIEETNLAEKILNIYVGKYKELYEMQEVMLKIQREAKALRVFADAEKNNLDGCCDELNRQKAVLAEEREGLLYKQESMTVLKSESARNKAEKDLTNAKADLEKKKELYDKKAGRKESIELHKARYEVMEWESKILLTKEDIDRLEQDLDMEEIQSIYEQYARKLKSCYVGLEDSINKKLEETKLQIKKSESNRELLRDKIESKNKDLNALNNKKSGLEGECATDSKKILANKRKILIDIQNERVEDVLNNYNKRVKEIAGVQAELDSKINEIDIRAAAIRAEQPVIEDKRAKANERFITVKNRLQDIEDQINTITSFLSVKYKEFDNVKAFNFYSKEQVIKEKFTVLLYNAEKNKEEALTNERLKKRLSDGYDKNEYFTGVPELYNIIEELKSKFDFIQAGGQYVNQVAETLNISSEDILVRFPFWHYAIIVNESDADKLKWELSKTEQVCPVLILTLSAAKILVEDRGFDVDVVTPEFWISSLDKGSFADWKESIKAQGENAEEARRSAEGMVAQVQGDANEVESFFIASPGASYLKMCSEKTEFESQLNDVIEREREFKKELDRMENERREAVSRKNDLAQETFQIIKNREYAQDILKMEETNKTRGKEIMNIEEQLIKADQEIREAKRDLEEANRDIDWQKDEKNQISSQLWKLQDEKWYKEVKDMRLEESGNIPKKVLIEELEKLQPELMRVSTERKVLEERLSGHQANLGRAKTYFQNLKKAANYPWDEESEYYEGMERELEGLNEKIPHLYQEMKNEEAKTEKYKNIVVGKEVLYEDCLQKFKSRYEELYIFQKSLNEAEEDLREEANRISSKAEALEKERQAVENERSKAEKAIEKLTILESVYNFGTIDIGGEETKEALNYSYNRMKIVENLEAELRMAAIHINEKEKIINDAKKDYSNHCRQDISDIRNRDRLIDVVERASNYKELIENQKSMNSSLESAKMVAHTSLADSENKMIQFRNHLYTHVEKIAKELLLIPKKTRIRTTDGWKEIFDISFEEWDEQEARMALQSQISYILDRIERGSDFKTDEGVEDLTKIRAFIEKSFSTKQLLKKILGSKEIRVRCRKVTNNNEIASRLCSWEESEKWSGGERWSKNMALFLGIQNYIAEKTEPDLKSIKSRSCVFLDNPFGKASSEHVLNPVFFIADALGFQIITVTAHAEGKFIGDYFPIVYSLKLREAAEAKTSVITKELTIKHAYFEDRDPIEFSRLMLREQMSLF